MREDTVCLLCGLRGVPSRSGRILHCEGSGEGKCDLYEALCNGFAPALTGALTSGTWARALVCVVPGDSFLRS